MRRGPEGSPFGEEGGRHPCKQRVPVLTQMLAGGAAPALHQKRDLPPSQPAWHAQHPPSRLLDEAGLQPRSFIAARSVMSCNTAKCKRNLDSNLDALWDTNLSAETLLKAVWVWKVTVALVFFHMSESKTPEFANRPTSLVVKHQSLEQKFAAFELKKGTFLLLPADFLSGVLRNSAGKKVN